eukprot:7596493-Pyramimonas_sp.AAC.1
MPATAKSHHKDERGRNPSRDHISPSKNNCPASCPDQGGAAACSHALGASWRYLWAVVGPRSGPLGTTADAVLTLLGPPW